jgi:DNA-binding GntR family transcriptional regulator
MPTQEAPLISRTIAEAVTLRLRQAILAGEFKPGTVLSQELLASHFGVSRVPIREALKHLASEGLVNLQAHHSATVSTYTTAQIEELVFIASALDVAAMRRAMPIMKEAELRHMGDLLAAMRKCEDKPAEWLPLNLEFHLVPIRVVAWPQLELLVVESRRNLGRFVQPIYSDTLRSWDAQHGDIYEACKTGNAERAQALLEHHWLFTFQEMARLLGQDAEQRRAA